MDAKVSARPWTPAVNTTWLNGMVNGQRVIEAAWIDLKTSAEIMCISEGQLLKLRGKLAAEWSIEWRPNSANDTVQNAQGCGLLLLRADVERVARIRRLCRLSVRHAIQVYGAIATYGAL
jgi:hypothetical protein